MASYRLSIKVRAIKAEAQAKHGAKFAGLVLVGTTIVGVGKGDTKLEARAEAKRAAEEMGLVSL